MAKTPKPIALRRYVPAERERSRIMQSAVSRWPMRTSSWMKRCASPNLFHVGPIVVGSVRWMCTYGLEESPSSIVVDLELLPPRLEEARD